VWFEDFGSSKLVEGQARVSLEPIFAQTVNTSEPYHVFLTPLGDKPALLFVTTKGRDAFAVRGVTLAGGPADMTFDWRVVAKRAGYENKRLELGDKAPARALHEPRYPSGSLPHLSGSGQQEGGQ